MIKYIEEKTVLNQPLIFSFLAGLDQMFNPKLSERISLHEYSWKLYTKAFIISAWSNEKLIGICAFYINESEGTAFLSFLGISSEFQRFGIASDLITRMIKKCLSSKLAIGLHVDMANEKAIKFYIKHGFNKTGKKDNQLIMIKRL